jgi:hypothetical protein
MIAQGLLILGLCAGVSAGVAGVYFQGKKAGANEVRAQVLTSQQIADAAAAKVADQAAEAISKIKVQNRTITQEVQREVLERVVYRECVHAPDVVQRINAALTGEGAEPAGTGILPTTDAAGRHKFRGDDAQAAGGSRAVP